MLQANLPLHQVLEDVILFIHGHHVLLLHDSHEASSQGDQQGEVPQERKRARMGERRSEIISIVLPNVEC